VGTYAPATARSPPDAHLLRAHATLIRVHGVAASHVTAAAAHGLPVRDSDFTTVHLSPLATRLGKPKAGPGYNMHSLVVDDELSSAGPVSAT
jgi:hypothetical protein